MTIVLCSFAFVSAPSSDAATTRHRASQTRYLPAKHKATRKPAHKPKPAHKVAVNKSKVVKKKARPVAAAEAKVPAKSVVVAASVAVAASAPITPVPVAPAPVTPVPITPATPSPTPPVTGGLTPHPTMCAVVLAIGLRGSGEGPQGAAALDPDSYVINGWQNWGRELQDVWTALALSMTQRGTGVAAINLVYPAASLDSMSTQYMTSVAAGVNELRSFLTAQEVLCPTQRIVLIGYSQGATVIHSVLVSLAATNSAVVTPQHLAAVLLVADPSRVAQAAGPNLGTAVAAAYGIGPALTFGGTYAGCFSLAYMPCALGIPFAALSLPDIPAGLAGVTASLCNAGDIVCATDPAHMSDGFLIHISYSSSALANLGAWAVSRI